MRNVKYTEAEILSQSYYALRETTVIKLPLNAASYSLSKIEKNHDLVNELILVARC